MHRQSLHLSRPRARAIRPLRSHQEPVYQAA
jgi:hypothetical protein